MKGGWIRTKQGVVTWWETCHESCFLLPLPITAVGVITLLNFSTTICLNSRTLLNRLASRRGSLAENSANLLQTAIDHTGIYTDAFSFFLLSVHTLSGNCAKGGLMIYKIMSPRFFFLFVLRKSDIFQ